MTAATRFRQAEAGHADKPHRSLRGPRLDFTPIPNRHAELHGFASYDNLLGRLKKLGAFPHLTGRLRKRRRGLLWTESGFAVSMMATLADGPYDIFISLFYVCT
jgi:hypothetical protein